MSSIVSNAYNFSENITAGVDVRTGMFSFSINLSEFFSHRNTGPIFNMLLNYSAANNQDMGFGRGWGLSLSRYHQDTLSLSTGQSFEIVWNGDKEEYDIPYRKLRDLRVFYLDATGEIQVVYKDGRKDYINWEKGTLDKMVSPQGLEVHFEYHSYNNNLCLSRIYDGEREITIDWWTNPWQTVVEHSLGGILYQKFLFGLTGGGGGTKRLDTITFPDASQTTQVGYRYVAACDYDLITKVTHATGMTEEMTYLDDGHSLQSGAPISKVPYITSYVSSPGEGQQAQTVTYDYSDSNYLGFGSDGGYTPGEDTLFKAQKDYRYSCIETINGSRVIERTFNKYHLLEGILHRDQGTLFLEEDNDYFANLTAGIEAQPATYSLLKSSSQIYHHGSVSKTFKTTYTYDDYGNQTQVEQPDGTVTSRTFYPAAGEPGECPPEPNGMVALLKQETVHPSSTANGETPRHTEMTYEQMAALGSTGGSFVVLSTVTDGNESTAYTYCPETENPYQYGRTLTEATTVGPSTQTTTYTYDFADDVLKTTASLHTHDGLKAVASETTSYLDGQVLETVDHDGVQTVNSYDAIGRPAGISVAPGTQNAAVVSHVYVIGNGNNTMTTTDAKGNRLIRHFNGAGKEIHVEQSGIDGSLKTINRYTYDAFGLLVTKTETDWLDDVALELTTTYEHDVHGQVDKITHPDGRIERIEQNIPALTTEYETPGLLKEITVFNTAGLMVSKESLDLSASGARLAKTQYRYDGFSNLIGTTDTGGHETVYRYDTNDRLVDVEREIDVLNAEQEVERQTVIQSITYAGSTTAPLPTDIEVNGTSLGTRLYDGLDRVIEEHVAGATRLFGYSGASSMPSDQTTAKGDILTYTNNPYLQMPNSRVAAGLSCDFSYDHVTGDLTNDSSSDAQRTSVYNRLGFLESETVQLDDGIPRTAKHHHSLGGLLLSREDFFGNATTYSYDGLGRLEIVVSTQNGEAVTTTISYDSHSRPEKYVSVHGNDELSIELEFNAVGLETLRTVLLNGAQIFTLEQDFNVDLQVKSRVYTAGTDVTTETMTYDEFHRLISYKCSGPNAPRDRYSNVVREQRFDYDVFYNVTQTETLFTDGTSNSASYTYEPDNPTRLKSLTNSHPDYPAQADLVYDDAGNLESDERGLSYQYNALDQVSSVSEGTTELSRYRYNATGQVVAQTQDDQDIYLHYHGYQLANESSGDEQASYQLVGGAASRTVVSPEMTDHQFLVANAQGSILTTLNRSGAGDRIRADHQYTPSGERQDAVTGATNRLAQNPLGFNGERQDPVTGLYHLGNGYRIYNPALMRFHSCDSMSPFSPSDSMSPFGKGGVNAYAYCLGDPINLKDPSGHFGLLSLLIGAIVGAVVGAAISTVSEGIKSLVTGEKFDARQVGIGAALGFISGGFGVAAQGAKTSVQAGLIIADTVVTGSADFGLSVATGSSLKDAGIGAGIGAIVGFASIGVGEGVGKVAKGLRKAKKAKPKTGRAAGKKAQQAGRKKTRQKMSKLIAKGVGDEKKVRYTLMQEVATGMAEDAVSASLIEISTGSGSEETRARQKEIDGSSSYASQNHPHFGSAEVSGRKMMEPDFVHQGTKEVSVARLLVTDLRLEDVAS